jgi:asparagine synthase (glutamine-hydrolysing)
MPHGLLAVEEISPQADALSLERLARFARPADDATYLRGIRTVAPGETIAFTPGSARRAAHWLPPQSPLLLPRDEDYVEAVRETLDLAVAARLRGGETGLACHLSAGLDSSAVTATAARLHTAARPLAAITVGPSGAFHSPGGDRLADERRLAAVTASLYESVEHVVVERANRSPIEHFETWFDLFRRPVADVINQDWYLAANEAAQARGASVLLHGRLRTCRATSRRWIRCRRRSISCTCTPRCCRCTRSVS